MTERPILFSATMVRAILDGTKTQTRRIITGHPGGDWHNDGLGRITSKHPKQGRFGLFVRRGVGTDFPEIDIVPCPYGQPGDQLWVRETHAIVPRTAYAHSEGVQQTLRPDDPYEHDAAIYREGWTRSNGGFRWRPSIHMPRWASRISLEITSVRVERLQDISEADAKAEGAEEAFNTDKGYEAHPLGNHQEGFAKLWTEINGHESWEANPWVWVVEFTRTERPKRKKATDEQ